MNKARPVVAISSLLTLSIPAVVLLTNFAEARARQVTFSMSEDFDCEQEKNIITPSDLNFCTTSQSLEVTPFCDARELSDNGQVWRVGSNRWNDEWEAKFANWIKTDADAGFFERYKIATDCADAAMAFRGIFARIHHLPFRIQAETGRKREAMGHDSTKYAHLKTVRVWNESNWKTSIRLDDRFRAYLEYTLREHGTGDIPHNTYPVAITRREGCELNPKFGAGTVCFTGSHTQTITNIDQTCFNPLTMMSSTTPAEVRSLNVEADRGSFWRITGKQENELKIALAQKKQGVGYVGWNWDIVCNGAWSKVKDKAMPDYSEEQYYMGNPSISHLLRELYRVVPDEKYFASQLAAIETLIKGRIVVVNQAIALQADEKKLALLKDTTSQLWDDLSTPHRDTKICDKLADLFVAVNDPQSTLKAGELFVKMNAIKLTIGDRTTSLLDVIPFCSENYSSKSDPAEAFDSRWAVNRSNSFWSGTSSAGVPWRYQADDTQITADILIAANGTRVDVKSRTDSEIWEISRAQTSLETGKTLNYAIEGKSETEFDPATGLPVFTSTLSYWDRQGETLYFSDDGKTVVKKARYQNNRLREITTYVPGTTLPLLHEDFTQGCEHSTYCLVVSHYSDKGKLLNRETLYSEIYNVDSPRTKLESKTWYAIDDDRKVKEEHYDRNGRQIRLTYYRANPENRLVIDLFEDGSEARSEYVGFQLTEKTLANARGTITQQTKFAPGGTRLSEYYPDRKEMIRFFQIGYDTFVQGLYKVENGNTDIGPSPFQPKEGTLVRVSLGMDNLSAAHFVAAKTAAVKTVSERYLVKHPLRQSFHEGLCKLTYHASSDEFEMAGSKALVKASQKMILELVARIERGDCYYGKDDYGNMAFALPNTMDRKPVPGLNRLWQKIRSRFGYEVAQ